MVRIPIEIVYNILDFVDIKSAVRFQIAILGNSLDRYLSARIRTCFNESLSEIRKINYSIEIYSDNGYIVVDSCRNDIQYHLWRDFRANMLSLGIDIWDALLVYGGKLTTTDIGTYEFLHYSALSPYREIIRHKSYWSICTHIERLNINAISIRSKYAVY